MGFLRCLFILLTAATSPAALAIAPVNAREYVAERKKSACVPIEIVRSDPAAYIGKNLEIRGRVCGLLGSGKSHTLIITARDGCSYEAKTDVPPVENPGAELACVVKVGEGSVHSLSDLTLVLCAYDVDLVRLEEAWQKAAQDKASRGKAAREKSAAVARKTTGGNARSVTAEQLTAAYRSAIKRFNCKLTDSQADTIARSVLGFSYRYKVDPRLVCAVILAESHFRVGATSRCGAQGLGQLMPSTAAGMGVNNAYDPIQNVYGSVRYIKGMLDRMSGNKRWNELTWYDLGLALAAYNAGPGAVKKHGGIPPYRETRNYVRRVTSIYKQLCGVR